MSYFANRILKYALACVQTSFKDATSSLLNAAYSITEDSFGIGVKALCSIERTEGLYICREDDSGTPKTKR